MPKEALLQNLASAVIDGDLEDAVSTTLQGLDMGLDPLEMVESGLSVGMRQIGVQFENEEVFLPELLLASRAFNAAMEKIKPVLEVQNKVTNTFGTVVIGTVKGDMHNIGKNIVSTLLEIGGFKVVDLGVDNHAFSFIQAAEKAQADIIALSCLMTTTMPSQKDVIDTLKEMGMREKYWVIVGGGPTSQAWADQIGADGYGASAIEAVRVAKSLVQRRRGI